MGTGSGGWGRRRDLRWSIVVSGWLQMVVTLSVTTAILTLAVLTRVSTLGMEFFRRRIGWGILLMLRVLAFAHGVATSERQHCPGADEHKQQQRQITI